MTETSSNINEGIKAVLFFKRKDFTHTQSTTTHISEQKQKAVLNALKKHLRGRESLVCLYALLCFLCAFCAFCAFLCVKTKNKQYFYGHKNI